MIERDGRAHRRLERERGPHRYCYGSSESSSQANTTTQNYDLRVAGGNNSTNISAHSSTVYALDANAVNMSFGFARDALNGALSGVAGSVEEIRSAYSEAKAGEQKVLVAGALLIGGIVALKALGKG